MVEIWLLKILKFYIQYIDCIQLFYNNNPISSPFTFILMKNLKINDI